MKKYFKGFDKNLKCRDFQYEIGREYEEESADLCNNGFHACESPLNVFGYYPPADSRYCEVELDGMTNQHGDDSKVCGKKIKIGAEIGIPGLVKAHVEWVKENLDKTVEKSTNTGNWSAATNTGDQSAATNTGDWSAAEVSGKASVAITTGIDSKARGSLGCAICIVERGDWDGATYPIKNIKAVIVDGETVKSDVWYTLKNGEFVEVSED